MRTKITGWVRILAGSFIFSAVPGLPQPLLAQAAVFTEDGPVTGIQTSGVNAWLGIPYAAPPVGNLRWMPPRMHSSFTGTLAANTFGTVCPQPDGVGGVLGSEDCLTLNIFAPLQTNNNVFPGLPVMVWIPGGGLVTGGSFNLDPSPLVTTGNVIVVTMNYRLGFLGFFAHPAIDAEGHLDGNYGLMDQQFALQWIQRNISAFGGDPTSITLFGESAGGQSVEANLASPMAAGLFQRAISQSGAYDQFQDYFNFIVPLATAETNGTASVPSGTSIAAAVGCSSQTAPCLRSLPASTLVLAESGETTLYPFVDGIILPNTPAAALVSGQFNHVPVISGGNHDEYRLSVSPSTTPADFSNVLAKLVGPALANAMELQYPLTNYPSAALALATLGTDAYFACPQRNSVRALSQWVTTWAYEFNDEHAPALLIQATPAGYPTGAYHTAELQYLFNLNAWAAVNPFTPDQQQLSSIMIRYWTQFATTGDPNFPGGPAWLPYSAASDQFQSLVPPAPSPESGFAADHKCTSFWNTF